MALREAWTRAADDRLPPKEQAKLWGAREALRKLDQDDTQYAWMASKVRVNGQGDRHPGRQSVREFFDGVSYIIAIRKLTQIKPKRTPNNANTPVRFYYFMG